MDATPARSGHLATKLARIMLEIGKVPKTGFNSFHKYNYVTENDLVYAVRDKLSAAGVFVFTSVEKQSHEVIGDGDRKQLLTSVELLHTFVDGETGDTFAVRSQGQGSDVGDKGGYKAITGAMKYFLYKCFMIPTGDDPEADNKTDERGASGGTHREPADTSADREHPADRKVEVPRDASVGLIEQFRDNKWEKHKIHFGNYQGTALGELSAQALKGWTQWVPQPYKGTISKENLLLQAALAAAKEETQKND